MLLVQEQTCLLHHIMSVCDSAATWMTHHIPTERTTAIKRAITVSCCLQTAISHAFLAAYECL